jgi:hypothetical protein
MYDGTGEKSMQIGFKFKEKCSRKFFAQCVKSSQELVNITASLMNLLVQG